MKSISILFFLTLCQLLLGQERTITVDVENAFPEGLAYAKNTNTLYCGSMMNGVLHETEVSKSTFKRFPANENPPSALGIKVFDDRIYVATGTKGTVEVYSTTYRQKLFEFIVPKSLNKNEIFINDIAVVKTNVGYVTDSFRPVIYSFNKQEGNILKEWLKLDKSSIKYKTGYNLNGIVLTQDQKYLIIIQTNTGELFRINTVSKEIIKINIKGASLLNGDGLAIENNVIYVALNIDGKLAKIDMDKDFSTGTATIANDGFEFPTAVAVGKNKVYVLNSQLDQAKIENVKIKQFKISVLSKK